MEFVNAKNITLAAIFVLFSAGFMTASASVYHVAPSGSDNNNGSPDKPLRTIQKAADMTKPGDTVMVHAGTYQEQVTIKNSGSPEQPICFQGERGPKGEWLSILDMSRQTGKWLPAPEIGKGVFKTNDIKFSPNCMTVEGKQLLRIRDDYMKLPVNRKEWSNADSELKDFCDWKASITPGFYYLSLPSDAMVNVLYLKGKMKYWDGIEALYAYLDGTTYIRFRNGDNPNEKDIKAAPKGGGIQIKDKSHIAISDLLIRGAENCIVLEGKDCHDNIIEKNYLSHGRSRVRVIKGSSRNRIRNNEMTLGYHGYSSPGAWGPATVENYQTAIRVHIYREFKRTMGNSVSDDRGLLIDGAGEGNEVSGNHIFNGLIGIDCSNTPRLDFHHNTIHNMSSVGICTIEGVVDGHFHDNLIYDCNINLRIHHYNTPRDNERSEYYYRNRFYEPGNTGTQIYVHVLNGGWPANTRHPRIYLYQNTFAGGRFVFNPSGPDSIGSGMPGTLFLNNIFSGGQFCHCRKFMSDKSSLSLFDYNWAGGEYGYKGLIPAWFGKHNINAQDQLLWDITGMPDFRLPENSTARAIGIDLSKPYTIDGQTYPALPGMKPGYFSGKAPDAGALQYGEKSGH